MNKAEFKKNFEKRVVTFIGKDWEDLALDKREKLLVDFVEKNYDEIDALRETGKDIREQNRDTVLFTFGILLGIIGGLIGDIIKAFLSGYGTIYDAIIFILFLSICFFFARFIRLEKSKTVESNRSLRNFLTEVEKELEEGEPRKKISKRKK
jgi:pilus assembly protein TadC